MIKAIYIADLVGHLRSSVRSASVDADKGIAGDRNYDRSNWPGQNVTFIEIEEIDRYNTELGQDVAPWEFGRNVVTEGVRLNDLVGKEFAIGVARFRGIELCEPCATLGGYLANASMSKADVVKALVHRAGLRADVVESGEIAAGMTVRVV